jgi:hypothetical protein
MSYDSLNAFVLFKLLLETSGELTLWILSWEENAFPTLPLVLFFVRIIALECDLRL